MSCSINRW